MPCLVCEIVHGKPPIDGYRFENCTILNNHSILKKQFISFCSTIRGSRRALKNHDIKRLQISDANNETESDDKDDSSTASDSPDDNQDFPQGRYQIWIIAACLHQYPQNLRTSLNIPMIHPSYTVSTLSTLFNLFLRHPLHIIRHIYPTKSET